MRSVLLSLLAVSAVSGADIASHFPRTWAEFTASKSSVEGLFETYKVTFAKKYDGKADEAAHFETFKASVTRVLDFNDEKSHTYTKGITQFADLSTEERKRFVMPETKATSKVQSSGSEKPKSKTIVNSGNWNMNAQTCDLRQFTTSVKNQASCGSCWAFGTAAAAEGSHFLWSLTDSTGHYSANVDNTADHYKDATQVSEQVLLECCTVGASGCSGGGTFQPMECAVRLGALPSTISHPYLANANNNTCAVTKSEGVVSVESWHQPCDLDEACLKSYIGGDSCNEFSTTAIKTSIEVIDSFYDYVDGVYSDASCPTDVHNHAVTIVGWGTDAASGKDYWMVRNSWGPAWGQAGHIFMERGVNTCCIACDNLFFQ